MRRTILFFLQERLELIKELGPKTDAVNPWVKIAHLSYECWGSST